MANFRDAFPKEYLDGLNNVALVMILPAVAAWLLPFFVDIFSQKRQRDYLSKYIKIIDEVYHKYDNNKKPVLWVSEK